MGIKSNFLNFIRKQAGPETIGVGHMSDFRGKKIAIDSNLFLFKFKAGMGGDWLKGFINLIQLFRSHNVHPVFIFDGETPEEKKGEQQERRDAKKKLEDNLTKYELDLETYITDGTVSDNLSRLCGDKELTISTIRECLDRKQRQIVHISPADFTTLKDLITTLGIPCYESASEGEKLCAQLCIEGKVSAVLSDDTDVVAYGSPTTLSKLNMRDGTFDILGYETLLDAMDMKTDQFLEFCVMCGTDYNKNLPGIGSKSAYDILKKHGTIDVFATETTTDVSSLTHRHVISLFREFETHGIETVPYCGVINTNALDLFLHTHRLTVNTSRFEADTSNHLVFTTD